MEQAIEAYRHISESDRLKEIQRMRDKAWVNETYAMLKVKEDTSKQVARKMKTANKPISEIIDFTGLSTETIQSL